MLLPVLVEHLQQQRLLRRAHDLRRRCARPSPPSCASTASVMRSRIASSAMPSSLAQSAIGRLRPKMRSTSSCSAGGLPLLGVGLLRDVARDQVVDDLLAHARDRRRRGRSPASGPCAARRSPCAGRSSRCRSLQQVLADLEVARLDLLLRLLQRLVDPGMGDRLALLAGPRRCSMVSMRSEPKMRIRSSSSER